MAPRRGNSNTAPTRPFRPPAPRGAPEAPGRGLTPVVPRAYIIAAPNATWGRMAEWLCNGLQIRVQRFDSASGLQRFFLLLFSGLKRAAREAGRYMRGRTLERPLWNFPSNHILLDRPLLNAVF